MWGMKATDNWLRKYEKQLTDTGMVIWREYARELRVHNAIHERNIQDFILLCNTLGTYNRLNDSMDPEVRQVLSETDGVITEMIKKIGIKLHLGRLEVDLARPNVIFR